MEPGPSIQRKLMEIASDLVEKIRSTVKMHPHEAANQRELAEHIADYGLATERWRTYKPIDGEQVRCPRCWVVSGEIGLLEKSGITIPATNEYGVICSICHYTALLPLK